MRPEVQAPEPSRIALMASLPLPSRDTFAVLADAVSTSPVPQFAAPPGYDVPVRSSQLAADGDVPAAPSKPSDHTVVKSPGTPAVGELVGVVPTPLVKILNS